MPKHPEPKKQASFQKVAECLYRNESSKVYYALVKRSGKQIRRSLKTTDRKLAERRLKDFVGKVEMLDLSKRDASLAFAELAQIWLQTIRGHLKTSSAMRREVSIKQLNRHFGTSNVRKITRLDCEAWASGRASQRAASTFNNERETLVSILDYAVREGLILDNPATVIKRKKVGKKALIIPTHAQFKNLLATMRALDVRYHPAADLVELLAYSGMRKSEANSLLWKDVDFKNGRFTVTGGSTGTKNHEARIVPMFPILETFLRRKQNGIERVPEAPIVPVGNAKKAIDAACKKADLPHFSHHSFRHFFVSNAIEKGVDFKTIAAWVGHKDGGVLVAQTYGHLRDTHSMEMAKRMTL